MRFGVSALLIALLGSGACTSDGGGDTTVIDGSVIDGSVTDGSVTDGSVTDGSVTDGSVTDGPLADGSVTDGPLADGPLADGPLADGPLADGGIADSGIPDVPTTAEYGARLVPASKTPSSDDVFVSPNGSGTSCTQASPCALATGISQGGFIWLMDGTYTTSSQISVHDNKTIEAMNRHKAIIDFGGSAEGRVTLGDNNVLRNFVIRNAGQTGLTVFGNNNLLEGMISEGHFYSGFSVWASSGYDNLSNPTGGSYNIFRDTIARNNSENCAKFGGVIPCTDSDADGISISNGRGNEIIHCEAINNADDGFDVWRSYESVVRNSIAHGSGRNPAGQRIGNGNGYKMGSTIGPIPNNHRFINNWSYDNEVSDFSQNGGQGFAEISGNVCGINKSSCSP